MLVDSKLPISFWAEAVSTACYVQNRVLVIKPHRKTPYELLFGRTPSLSFMRPFGCHVTILNTKDHLGKFEGKADEGYMIGYSLQSKAYRVYNKCTRLVEENLHIEFQEKLPNVAGIGPDWCFDIDKLSESMNYVPVTGTNTNDNAGFEDNGETNDDQDHIWMPIWKESVSSSSHGEPSKTTNEGVEDDQGTQGQENQGNSENENGTNSSPNCTSSSSDGTASSQVDPAEPLNVLSNDSLPEDVGIGNLPITYDVPTTHSSRILKDHSIDNVIGSIDSGVKTRTQVLSSDQEGFVLAVYEEKNNEIANLCLFSCFLSQIEPKNITKALDDSSWVEAMQEELLQFKLQKVWILVDLPKGFRAIGTKWVFRNKKDERGIVIKKKKQSKIGGPRVYSRRRSGL
jgi:hypothetical protein